MKKKLISTVLCMAMVLGGASTVFAEDGDAAKTFDGEEISILWVSNSSMNGINALIEAAEEKLDIKVSLEQAPGGEDGDNVVKTRLASGDMADLLSYNCGSLLASLNPSEYFEDITDDYADMLDASFVGAAGVD